ncbi:MAG TPA: hypothetical protein VH760_10080 [Gaiellaceae bacterium]|jgi:hypothetical protein
MTRTRILTAAAIAALGVVAGTARADDGGPQITAGTGCAVQCVKKAAVTPTASSAKVELETTVVSVVTVWVARQATGSPPGTLTASQAKVVKLYLPAGMTRIASFDGLEPDTTYAIGVKATDVHGKSSTRTGTFKTLTVKTNGLGGADTIDSGLGCSVQCITKALFSQAPPNGSIAAVDLKTAADAKIELTVTREYSVVSEQTSPGFVRAWKTQVGGLLPGTSYGVNVRATDRQGRVAERHGSFRTVSATALVTIHKIKIVNDGDKGKAKGELYFRYFFAGHEHGNYGFRKLGSGAVIDAKVAGTSRPGAFYRFSANGDARLDVHVSAEECDGHTYMKNCEVEQDLSGQHTFVGGNFRLADILSGALPGWYGTGVSQPAGHDGYFVFGPGSDYVKIQVLATVDLDYDWPS